MTEINGQNLNVDLLFEQHSLSQINNVQKKLDTEVEKKREELRTMVGERYRDLLKAADTIAIMKDTSSSVIGKVDSIIKNVKILNEKQLVGFKTDLDSCNRSKQDLAHFYSTVLQIKLLTDIPELIWTSIDEENFSISTELFIFARHISAGLQLDVKNKYMENLPVAKKQWEMVKPFYFILKEKCLNVLEREDLSSKLAADCLLSLYLLEKTSLDQLFQTYLHFRSKAFIATLSSEQNTERRVKDRIIASLMVLNRTVEHIYRIFNTKNGHFSELLKNFQSETKPATIFLLNLDDDNMTKVLPDIVAKFNPTFEAPTFTKTSFKTGIDSWLKVVTNETQIQLKKLFDLVSSMKTIQEIKKEANLIKNQSNWNDICEFLSIPNELNFYEQQYEPILNQRTQNIIQQSWNICVNIAFDDTIEMLRYYKKHSESEEIDFWTEDLSDIISSLNKITGQDKKPSKLAMKTKGFNEKIVKICTTFDDRLKIIFSEINSFLDDNEDNKSVEKEALIEFLKDTSQKNVIQLVNKIKTANNDLNFKQLIALERLFLAFIELCPNLKLCLTHSYLISSWNKISLDKKNQEKWIEVCNLFEYEGFEIWKIFCELLFKELPIEGTISQNVGLSTILKDFVNWDTIKVEEKDEKDNPVQSTIKIPAQPRISLQMYLMKVIEFLNKWIPQTLPRKVLLHLDSKLIENFLAHYKILIANKFVASNQNIALQLYFDLKVLQLLFIARDDKIQIDKFQKLTNSLKNFVDPFDFELFHSYLNSNAKKCVYRMQNMLGVILPYPENISMSTDLKQSSGVLDKDPNVLTLCSNGSTSSWFPLLPVVFSENKNIAALHDTENMSTASKKKQELQASTTQSTNSNNTSNVKSGAVSFFGAMSQDWFR